MPAPGLIASSNAKGAPVAASPQAFQGTLA
jgi:hypothetical protein